MRTCVRESRSRASAFTRDSQGTSLEPFRRAIRAAVGLSRSVELPTIAVLAEPSRFLNGIAETPIVGCQGNRGGANRDPEHDTGLQ